MNPTISIFMPSYNTACYIAEAVQSVINQSYKDWELIVQDDGSTDSTDTIMEYFVKKDKRIKYFKNGENLGIAKTRNNAYKHCTGKYIAIADSDDINSPDRLKLSLKAIKDADIVFSTMLNADADGKVFAITEVPDKIDLPKLRTGLQQVSIVTVMAKREVFDDHPYDETYKSNDDLRLIFEWYLSDYKWKKIDEPLVIHRHHQSSVTVRKWKEVEKYGEMAKKYLEEGLKKKGIK